MESFVPLIFKGLGWGIVHSLWVGAVCYGSLLLAFQFLNWRSKTKSLVLAATLCLLLACFCATVLYHLVGGVPTGTAMVSGVEVLLPQLLDQRDPVSLEARMEHYFPVVAACYTLGVLFQLVIVINGFRRLRTIRQQGLLDVPESWNALLIDKKRQLGIRVPVLLRLSTLVDVPAVIGHLKPIILFPMALFSGISMEQVEAVLIHELAHIKRRDYLVNFFKTIAETLLFFNPFVWLMGRMLAEERENACDDVVVRLTSKPVHYARTLLWLEEHRQQANRNLAMQAVGKKRQLLHRIQRMTNMRKNDLNMKHKLAALTLLFGCIASLAWVKPLTSGEELTEVHAVPPVVVGVEQGLLDDSYNVAAFQAIAVDTLPDRIVSTITIVDKEGVRHTYGGYKELPDSLKIIVDAVGRRADSLRIIYSGPEWQKKMERMQLAKKDRDSIAMQVRRHIDSLSHYFDSKEWKENFGAIWLNTDIFRRQADSIRHHIDGSAWRERFKEYAESHRLYLDSPEGKRARELLEKQLEENKANIAEWRDRIVGQDKIIQRYLDSIRTYLESPEWKSKLEQLRAESRDTTVVWPTMTINGPKADVEELLEIKAQLQALNRQELTTRQLRHNGRQWYQQLLEQYQEPYIDGSIKPHLNIR